MVLIKREAANTLKKMAKSYPVVTVVGPRQVGKTTLTRDVFSDKPYVNLEEPDVLEFAINDSRGFINQFPDGAILDEVQNAPKLLSYIQAIVDRENKSGQFILTGSQQIDLGAAISQSF
ncbi:MAG: AAA family ATPase [Proteobacteria bacterium]|nr:AAA family ATPase [Pseudomonadota bacterium]